MHRQGKVKKTPKVVVNKTDDNNSREISTKAGTEQDFKTKFKTEMCRNWELGRCPFMDKCAFAHGEHELREKTHIAVNYKTKKCIQFYQAGYCKYGLRCQFIHSQHFLSNSFSRSSSPTPQDRKRLPVFVNISNQET